jgi:hypothetical protein
VRFSHGRKSKSPKGLDPVSKAVAEDEGGNYRQKTFVNALKNEPGNCQGGREADEYVVFSPSGKLLQSKVALSH